jgi:hypothetical protein
MGNQVSVAELNSVGMPGVQQHDYPQQTQRTICNTSLDILLRALSMLNATACHTASHLKWSTSATLFSRCRGGELKDLTRVMCVLH